MWIEEEKKPLSDMSKMVDKPAEDTTMFNFENCLQV